MDKRYTQYIYVDGENREECTTEGIEGILRNPGEEIFIPRPKLGFRHAAYEVRNGPYVLTSSRENKILNLDPRSHEVTKEIFRIYEFHRCIYEEDFKFLPKELKKLL